MAFFDDPKLLIAHIRHSFITSDDSGMCELIMINEDLDNEIKSDHKFSKKSLRLQHRYNPTENYPRHAAMSFDIHASPTLSRRPPLKDNRDMFEVIAEQRRKKKSSQVRSIVWQDTSVVVDHTLFPRQEIPQRSKDTQPSRLAQLLAEYNKLSANPYFEFGRFNGENHGFAVANVYRIFLPMSKTPLRPIIITVLHKATIRDMIGLTFWKYIEETKDPVKLGPVDNYSVMISEEDGDIDTDLPPLEREDRVAKFRFKYLGIIKTKKDDDPPKHLVVKVHYEHGGFSTLAVDSLRVEMAELLDRVIKKRRLQIHGYELEKKDRPGLVVDLSSTLESQGTMDFILVKHIGRRQTAPASPMEDVDDDSSQTHVRAELTSHQYKAYRVIQMHKVRSNTEVLLGVSGQFIEVDPVSQSRSGLPSILRSKSAQKSNKYDIQKICACEITDDRNAQRVVFRIIRVGKEDGAYKHLDFEAPVAMAKEIVRKIGLILEVVFGGGKSDYEEWKEQNKGRKASKSVSVAS
ncbi:target of rapamycin complex 2 subunit MAPKAP1-like [Halichondria panicea]|uniref:target of rapamycin complex 2 subunit MAPKAP1-like n=1 Tax=Halichondria panicea TaxID=6063 RepID=UPI00312B2FA9